MGAVANKLYRALKIPDPGLAQQVFMLKLPRERSFQVDLIQWQKPRTAGQAPHPKSPGISGFTLRVDGIDKLDEIAQAVGPTGHCADEKQWAPVVEKIPGYGVMERVSFRDPDG